MQPQDGLVSSQCSLCLISFVDFDCKQARAAAVPPHSKQPQAAATPLPSMRRPEKAAESVGVDVVSAVPVRAGAVA